MEDSKRAQTEEIISSEDRTRIVNIVTVLQTLRASYLDGDYIWSIDDLILRINQNMYPDDFPINDPKREIAISFLNEFNKLEKYTEGGKETVKGAVQIFTDCLYGFNLPRLTPTRAAEDFSNQNLIDARSAITAATEHVDNESIKAGIKTKFRTVFYTAMDRPDLITPEIPPPRSSNSFWKLVAVGISGNLITAGLIYDSSQDWGFLKATCHSIASHPEISAPVGATLLFLAFVAVRYACSKSNGEEEDNQPQLEN